MRGQYILLVEQTRLLQESLSTISNDSDIIKQVIDELLHNPKLKPYILKGFGEDSHSPNYNKEDFISEKMGFVISKAKKESPVVVNTKNKIYQYVEQFIKNLAKNVIPKVKELFEDVEGGDINDQGEISRPDKTHIIQNIGKVIELLILLNDEKISKASTDFIIRPEKTGSSSILRLKPDQYVAEILKKAI